MKKRIITISGLPGTGKSSTANGVAKALSYKRFSSGDFMRQLGLERGLTIDQMQHLAEKDNSIDAAIDAKIRETGEQTDLVMDSRIAFYWLPESFKVLLKLDPRIAAKRTFMQMQQQGRLNQDGNTEEEIYTHLVRRIESEKMRYKTLYNIDYPTESAFDLVIDTNEHNLEQVIQLILQKYNEWLATN